MITLLLEQPLLLLFTIAALSYPLGRVRVGGVSLGVAAVLFVGLGFGALHPQMRLPDLVWEMGLVLFVYTVGLMNGPAFFASFRGDGLRQIGFALGLIALGVALVAVAARVFDLPAPLAAGLFAGSLTNTPALAAIVEHLARTLPADAPEALRNAPIVGYSLAYPVSVLGMIVAIALAQRVFRTDYAAEGRAMGLPTEGESPLRHTTLRVTRPEAAGRTVGVLAAELREGIVFGRVRHGDATVLATRDIRLEMGDLVTVVGDADAIERARRLLGDVSADDLALDRSALDFRRMFISSPHVSGRRIADLALPQQHGALITRVRRGDVDLLPTPDLVLQPGDRVRVLAERERLPALARYFGDSLRRLSEIDLLSFNVGLALGILVGLIPIPLPGGATVRLGLAGGPLVLALVLGARGRTGRIVWTLPYSANLVLRQVGLVLFLAGIGTRAGYSFFGLLGSAEGVLLLGLAAAIIGLVAFAGLFVGHRLLGYPMSVLTGLLAAMQTQPATLGFALEQSENEGPNVGYATVFPFALIIKVLVAQVLLLALSG